MDCGEEKRRQAESLLRSKDVDEVDKEYKELSQRFEELAEEDRKREGRLRRNDGRGRRDVWRCYEKCKGGKNKEVDPHRTTWHAHA